jgi:cobalt-precorrin 5A hydrolase
MTPDAAGDIALVTLSREGAAVAARVAASIPRADVYLHESVAWAEGTPCRFARVFELTPRLFERYAGIVYIMPCGIVARAIAPHLQHKLRDPAVVVLDVGARWAVSFLSGHEGGANDLAIRVANATGAEPVITTTTEAVKDLIVGVGCRRGAASEAVVEAVRSVLAEHGLDLARVRYLASADIKAGEPGLIEAAAVLGVPFRTVASDEITGTTRTDFERREIPQKHVGLPGVAEPSALLAGRRTELFVPRQIINSVTVAVARERCSWSA